MEYYFENEATEAVAVIDPYNCCYGDSEFDLYQLNNANEKELGLLERYKENSRSVKILR